MASERQNVDIAALFKAQSDEYKQVLNDKFSKFEESNDSKIKDLSQQFQTEISTLSSRLAALESRDDESMTGSNASTRATTTSAKRHRSAPPSRQDLPATSDANNKNRVWVVGFGRKLLAENFQEVASSWLREKIDDMHIRAAITVNAYNLRDHFSLDFPDHLSAVAFVKATKQGLQWQDRRSKTSKHIRTRLDRAPAERQLARVMGSVWRSAKAHLDSSSRWEPGIHMGTANGSFYLRQDGELFEPLLLLTDKRKDTLTIVGTKTNDSDTKTYGFTTELLTKWAQAAIEEEGLEWPVL